MTRRAWAAVHLGVMLSVAACTALLGGTDVPTPAPDAGHDGTSADAGDGGDAHHGHHPDAAEEACTDTCASGSVRCVGAGGVQTCSIQSDNCTAWNPVVPCPSGKCSGGQCLCNPPGSVQCLDNGVETCEPDGGFSPAVACGATADCQDGGCVTPLSCEQGGEGMTNCPGGFGAGSCCTSLEVPGGTFDRSYDDVTYVDAGFPASVSGFRLDRFEVTVARFRAFVSAVVGGYLPPNGSGKHTHLNGGQGLNATGGGHESGWDAAAWNGDLAKTMSDWNTNLECDSNYQTWTPSPGVNDANPINCETWYEAYAFCIWDGGFLPSEAEWNYAAAGGGGSGGQRAYPWSKPSTSTNIDCALANYAGTDGGLLCNPTGTNAVGSESPGGDGVWGQADLAGNVWEYNLDYYAASYVDPCPDCAYLTPTANRVIRGASFNDVAAHLLVSTRFDVTPATRLYNVGARCARVP